MGELMGGAWAGDPPIKSKWESPKEAKSWSEAVQLCHAPTQKEISVQKMETLNSKRSRRMGEGMITNIKLH